MTTPFPTISARRARSAFTFIEVTISLAVLAGAMVMVAQIATWALAERMRTEATLETVEAAANILEYAQVRPWNELNSEWANGLKLPESIASRWPDCRLAVQVEPEPKHPRTKRVTVEIKWTAPNRLAWQPVKLTGLFSARAQEAKP
jgi:hypothetical protein